MLHITGRSQNLHEFKGRSQQISYWMTDSLLTLNSSKTEFLLIGLKTDLPKYATLHLTPPTLLKISTLSLTNIWPSQTRLHFSPKHSSTFTTLLIHNSPSFSFSA